jgi:hypothetical protein
MELVDQIQFDAPINCASWNPGGDRVAVSVGDREVFLYGASQNRLIEEDVIPFAWGDQPPSGTEIRFRETKVALTEEQTLLVAQTATRSNPHGTWIELTGFDLRTKQVCGRFRCTGLDGLTVRGGLLSFGPHHALLGALKTVLCIDLRSFREVCRVRQIDELGDVADADADPEEQLAPDGFVHAPLERRVYLLCGRFNEAFLMRYRMEMPLETSQGEVPRFILEARQSALEGHDPTGLSLNPAGRGVTASFQIMDELIDLQGQEVTDWTVEQERMLSLRANPECSLPASARLGCLCIFSESESNRRIDTYSELERDFEQSPQQTNDSAGNVVTVGYRLSAGRTDLGGSMTKPVYLDNQRVAVCTPSGLLLCANTINGQTELMHDFRSPVTALEISRRERLLLVGCEVGVLNVLLA